MSRPVHNEADDSLRGMKHRIFLVVIIGWLGAATLASWLFNIPFWMAGVLALAGMFFSGLLAIIEDDLPGGFNNPDGTATPRYASVVTFVSKLLLVVFVISCVVVLALWRFS